MKRLTFKKVCEQIDKETKISETCDDLKVIFGAAFLFMGVAGVGGEIGLFLNTLTIKEEVINIGQNILDKILNHDADECDKRMNRMKWAYSIIYYTAFFDKLDEMLPKEIREKIALTLKEKQDIFLEAILEKKAKECLAIEDEIYFPSVLQSYADIKRNLKKLYVEMSGRVEQFVQMLSFEENSTEEQIMEFHSVVNELPSLALKRFESQYLYLASHYNEFYVYMQMVDEQIKEKKFEERYQNIISMGCGLNDKMDVGLKNLGEMIRHMPDQIREDKVRSIVQSMIEKYQREIDKPVLEISEKEREEEKLQYPSISEAFIPQSYKLIEYTGNEQLEKKETWKDIAACENMDSFWAKYYVSPDSLENLLLVLGEPGGGKSLLTKMLCGRMMDKNNIFIRIPLREVSVEKDIEDIVCEQIEIDGDASESIQTFKWFAENFKSNPITLVFDGYDEVLQATGGEYRNLLTKILKFQSVCGERHRPVRIIVTSRETLIDKAVIPVDTVVLKLLEFNEKQRNEWIRIWNQRNEEVFQREDINSFALPKNNESVEELSRQPLLLLMLAIYDADIEEGVNSLAREENLNRTRLYNELLRRFIRRELKKGSRGKGNSYEESPEEEQERMIELEMEKLGIAALGMFNRGKLFLHVSELKKDLLHMNAEMPVYENVGRMLEEAEVLFGSFFFIHHSKTGNENPVGKRRDETIKEEAFEFLHKTFYEFLVADVILKYLIREIDSLDDLGHSRKKENYEKALNDPNHLSKQYYTALMYMSLCKDVAIIHMLTEWKESLIALYFPGERSDFDTVFEALFVKQIDLFHERILIPDIWVRNVNDDKKKMSYLQHCATYLFNLLILKTIINCEQESRMELESWKKMAQFWKMNIPEEVILKFSAIFKVYRDEENVCVKKDFFIREVKQEKLREVRLNMANFLQDEFAYDLCILHNNEMENHSKQHCREELFKSGFDIEFEVVLGEIENLLLKGCEYVGLLMDNIKRGTTILYERKIIDSAMVFNWLMNINKLIEKTKFQSRNYKVVEGLSEIIFKEYGEDLSIVLEFFKVAKNITEDSRVQRQFESNYLVHWLYEQPKLFLNYVHSAKDYVLNREMAYSFFGNFKNIFYKDAESAIELFEMFYGFGVDMEMNSMLTWIWNWRDEICIKEPKAITKLLKFWIMINRKENVKEFLEENDVKIIEILNMNPEISADMLEIVQKVQIENNYADIVIENILCNFEKIFVKFPKVIIRLLNVINASNDYSFNRDMIRLILKNYGRVFHLAPQEAVLLLRIVQNTGRNDMCYPAVKYALAHFGEVLGTSVDTAIKLIYLCKKMPVKNSVDGLASYVRQCFEYIIFNDVVFDIGMMIGLLKKLDPKETAELRNYFGKRFIYIEEKYPALAKKIESCYNTGI